MKPHRIVYKISPDRRSNQWTVTTAGRMPHIFYLTQREAISFTRARALHQANRGQPSQIRLCGRDGRIRREWTYPRASDPKRSRG